MSTPPAPPVPPDRPPVFVYGTLRPGNANHDRLLRGRTAWTAPAVLPGAALHAGPGYPWAVDGTAADRVRGDLVQPLPAAYDRVLAALDRLEEYVPGDPGSLYVRVRRDVLGPDGTAVGAWVYLAGPAARRRLAAHGRRIADGEWHPDR
ncbi:gamma-glutamylcyclotransferase [Streptomyces sp. SL13]|uniref:Gamma-glutamylcyclotransferase n=1 Tax=Streptantibioticus silvisoli TaxID=2705255 RepID=A0AA90H067_9ACTN|nr:gamma-glutamylcyclotransferase family protein [Streptantibioticus silvisoli]MDI5961467.1 gamma-glutamylcyclotransferase [Streptantibioticus silvisoli]MDI5968050.1 gamma-glutamylcyclotransferase [Streptantibioticus silvisoli]